MPTLSNSPQQTLDFVLERRKSFGFRVNLFHGDGTSVDLTGCTLTYVVKDKEFDNDDFDVTNLIVNNQAVIPQPTEGYGVFSMQAAELDADPGEYFAGLVLWSPYNYSTLLLKGNFVLVANTESRSMHRMYSIDTPGSSVDVKLRDNIVLNIQANNLTRGPQGEKGDQGEPGVDGVDGAPGPQGEVGSQGPPGIQGEKGDPGTPGARGEKGDPGDVGAGGPPGPATTIAIGTVTTGAAGSSAGATMTGIAPNQTLNLVVPRGDNGATGATGATGAPGAVGNPGPANTLAIGTVTTGATGSSAVATITGAAPNQMLNLTLPRGVKGDTGAAGADGADGADGATGPAGPANTLTIGAVTTGTAGSAAAASVTGVAPNQTLNLTLPRGAAGPQGIQGVQGVAGTNGTDGTNGQGVPTGGTSGMFLMKKSGTDYDTEWRLHPKARFHLTSDFTMSASTWSRISFDSTSFNIGTGITLTAGTYVTVTDAGTYEIHFGGIWDPITGTPRRIARASKGSTIGTAVELGGSRIEFNTLDVMAMHGFWDGPLSAGDTVGIDAWSDSVNSYPKGSATQPWYFSIKRIG